MTTQTTYLSDPYDFCRECKGKGVIRYPTERGTTCAEQCMDCGGTGNRCVRITTTIEDKP